jgi:hypothetical protein
MKIQKFKRLFALLIVSLIFSGASHAAGFLPKKVKRDVKKTNYVRTDLIIKICPNVVEATPNPQEGWMRPGNLRIKWSNTKIVPTYNNYPPTVICNYKLSENFQLDYMFNLPNSNYTCAQVSGAPKMVECKSRPPIKIGGNKKGK